MCDNSWDPEVAGQRVRFIDNPARQGFTTGNTRKYGSRLHAQIEFGPGERSYISKDLLEPVDEIEDLKILLAQDRFGTPQDLQRILTLEKIKGRLTNVFYSMESSNTDFYPHQFKPVLKFIESPVGRLLIADEVGLGKTIEAGYIWKELIARENARRFLVICPAMLREKWRGDLLNKFGIAAEIIDVRTLLDRLGNSLVHQQSFVYIASLEGLRTPASYADENNQQSRAILGRLLEVNSNTVDSAILDLVVIDEAGYLRNPGTASNRLGRLLRDAAGHLLLLTATPVQIHSLNLYHLLNLIDPDTFYDQINFMEMLEANRPVINALRFVWRNPPDIESAREQIQRARQQTSFIMNHPLLDEVVKILDEDISNDRAKRVRAGHLLEASSLLGQFMNRSRKRDVLENRVERTPQLLSVDFNDAERRIYNHVRDQIRNRHQGESVLNIFTHILRLRQLASCMVAALEAWEEHGLTEELIWQDFGLSQDLHDVNSFELDDATNDLRPADIDLEALEKGDSKYSELKRFLKDELNKNPKEKFVIFAFFRQTLIYLRRRLEEDGVDTCLIMGGMGDEKYTVLDRFAEESGPNVLLSSEVGSEGIDLQFCRFLVNYDLPWNPMKVEQRIGRLDRLGQQSDRISIINFAVNDTIEDRILMRLFNRIDIFRETIGDLEEILGEMTVQLIEDLLAPNLTEEEMERKADDIALAIENKKREQDRLESEAINFFAFSDYIMDAISDTRERGYWLSPEELFNLVSDFFRRQYPGTTIEPNNVSQHAYSLHLSDDAKLSLLSFIEETSPGTNTLLHIVNRPVVCIFDPRHSRRHLRNSELIESTHPLIRWIRALYESQDIFLHPISAIQVNPQNVNLPSGAYAYAIHLWNFKGLRNECRLVFKIIDIESNELVADDLSEGVMTKIVRSGIEIPNVRYRLQAFDRLVEAYSLCDNYLGERYNDHEQSFIAENSSRCNMQEESARKSAERRINELRERIQRFEEQGNQRMIPPTKGLLRRVEGELNRKLDQIKRRRSVEPSFKPLAAGVILVD